MIYQKFPFGKYKGEPLDEIPTTYITYALEEFDLPDELAFDLKVILALRLNLTSEHKITSVKKAWKEMVNKYHPDKGGTNEQFQAVNDFYQTIINHG
jgi:uncharacterized protein (DUF3820 family)